MESVNILVVEDQTMVRELVVEKLQREPFAGVMYEAWNERSFLQVVKDHPLDMILLDMKLEDTSGLALFKKLASLGKQPYVIAFTALDGEEVVINCLKAAVDGMVHKDEGYGEMLKTINSVRFFGTYFSPEVKRIMKKNLDRWDEVPPVLLTPHEMDILTAISKGFTNIQVGASFKMTEGAAAKAKIRLMEKLGAKNGADLMIFACSNGIL